MYILVACGLCMFLFCAVAALWPDRMADGIITYSKKPYFQWLEVGTRFLLGVICVIFANETAHPKAFKAVGFIIMAVSFGLMAIGTKRHRQFAEWVTQLLRPYFRWIALLCLPVGWIVIFAALDWFPV